MSAETTRYLDLLEKRLTLLGSLAGALAAARTDIISLDIDGLETRIAEQEKLCAEIRGLDGLLDRIQRQCTTHAAPLAAKSSSDAVRYREILACLAAAQANVQQLNDQHRALLRRSRRTVNALLNSYHSFAMTYDNPSDRHAPGSAGGFSAAEGRF